MGGVHLSPASWELKGLLFKVYLMQKGGCQNYRPFLGTLSIRCRIIMGTQKGTIILTTTFNFGLGSRPKFEALLAGGQSKCLDHRCGGLQCLNTTQN